MRLHWLPWKWIIRRAARAHGLPDPVPLIARFNKFAQPSEVAAPIELMRSSMVLHARGLMNARTIQTNLDWIWPYWVQRQFDPRNPAFIPRSYALTHINLTHRNWTAVGCVGWSGYPIVDPRGLVTPFYDGWSLDGWMVDASGAWLLPSRVESATQWMLMEPRRYAVRTRLRLDGMTISTVAEAILEDDRPVCRVRYWLESQTPATFYLALRPANPEGVSFVHRIETDNGGGWIIDGRNCVAFETPMERHHVSTYAEGDVFRKLPNGSNRTETACDAGLATAAAGFEVAPGRLREVAVRVDLTLDEEITERKGNRSALSIDWSSVLEGACRLILPDERIQFLFDAAMRAMALHAPGEVYAGPFYYRRFWFRDAAFILQAMLWTGLHDRAQGVIERFPARQGRDGYFKSQHGEWDSNGQVLWILERFSRITGRGLSDDLWAALRKGGEWILKKRLPDDGLTPHAGLMPAGFSAEHLGHNDYYFWDDFWSVAGLTAAARLLRERGDGGTAARFDDGAAALMASVRRSLAETRHIRRFAGYPASPYRRMDAGAIGSLAAGYPTQLLSGTDPKLLETVAFLLARCFIEDLFFQDMFHSGLNVYLSLHCAQVLLRAGDRRFWSIFRKASDLASSTGQWPEAIHPHTLGGCQGDGQHIWTSAEWVMMLVHMFVREEKGSLVLLSGIPPEWLIPNRQIHFGPVQTPFGRLILDLHRNRRGVCMEWTARWRRRPETLVVRLAGYASADLEPDDAGGVGLMAI